MGKEIKVFLFADDDSLYKIPQKLHTKTLQEIINLSQVARYKVDTQKSTTFLYTNDKQTEKER